MHAIPVLPFVEGLLGRAQPFRQNLGGRVTRLDGGPHLGRRCRPRRRQWGSDQWHHPWQLLEPMTDNGSIVKMDQHGSTPFRISLRTDLALKKADRRGSMRSSGMEQLLIPRTTRENRVPEDRLSNLPVAG